MVARRLGTAAIGGAATTWLAWQRLEGTTALAEAPRQVEEDVKQGSIPVRLKAWLQEEQGANVSSLEFKPSKVGEEAGLGVYVAPGVRQLVTPARQVWWWPWSRPGAYAVVASFPLDKAITAANILADPQLGSSWQWLVEKDVLDERTLVEGYLAVERARGSGSPIAPWINALPITFHTPLYWSPDELEQLRGTALSRAVRTLRARLERSWGVIGPALAEVARRSGAPRTPTLDDYVWAHCVYWSRAQSLPVPLQPGSASQLVGSSSSSSSSGGSSQRRGGPGTRRQPPLIVHEGIVPGLDFVNHAPSESGAQCWWEVIRGEHGGSKTTAGEGVQGSGQAGGSGSSESSRGTGPGPHGSMLANVEVRLQLYRGARVRAGEEVLMSYGDRKPNEELLLLHGFVDDGDGKGSKGEALDTVMITLPLPPSSEWDEAMEARVQLLTSNGLTPQFFLKASDIQAPLSSSSSKRSEKGGPGDADAGAAWATVPIEVLEGVEVFVLDKRELMSRLEALRSHGPRSPQGVTALEQGDPLPKQASLTGSDLDLDALESAVKKSSKPGSLLAGMTLGEATTRLGLRMASLSTYVRLLEVQMYDLENDATGTGPLEADEQLLAAHRAAVKSSSSAAAPQGHSQAAGSVAQGTPGRLPHRRWCAVVYRAGQKRVVRAHVVGARRELQRVMKLMAVLQDMQAAERRAAEMKQQL